MSEPTVLLTGTLEQWAIIGTALYGHIYRDSKERWPDGYCIKLSKLVTPLSEVTAGGVVTTCNGSHYYLGDQAGD